MKKTILLLALISSTVFGQSSLSINIEGLEVDKSNLKKAKVSLKAVLLNEQSELKIANITKPYLKFDTPIYNGQSIFYGFTAKEAFTPDWVCEKFGYLKSISVEGNPLAFEGESVRYYTPLFYITKNRKSDKRTLVIGTGWFIHNSDYIKETVQCLMK